jgi:hypothetical protein
MKMILIATLAASVAATSATAQSTVHVRGHTTRDGVYVPPHERTAPNDTKTDNWSSKPNVNPYTGQTGTVDPYAPPKPYNPYKPK